tara:strand:+ start:237 stop:503 length:267 start_codon:yes stop_codon:yes gene_type:complete
VFLEALAFRQRRLIPAFLVRLLVLVFLVSLVSLVSLVIQQLPSLLLFLLFLLVLVSLVLLRRLLVLAFLGNSLRPNHLLLLFQMNLVE